MAYEEAVQEIGKNVDTEELLASFLIEMPSDYTEPEKTLKKELANLRRMRRTLTELSQIKKDEKIIAVPKKTGEKAKEEAMELLRSGAIQIADKKDRHTFKRKSKDAEDEESTRAPTKPTRDKHMLYGNFLRGPKLVPHSTEVGKTQTDKTVSPVVSPEHSSPSTEIADTSVNKRKQKLVTVPEMVDDEGNDFGSDDYHTLDTPSDSSTNPRIYLADNAKSSDTTLHVGYHKITEEFIRQSFEPLGRILRIKIAEHQNHAYVTMATHEMAQKALELDHKMVDNRLLRVGFARRTFSNSRPRRDQKLLGPFSPKSGFGRRNVPSATYNAVPPADSSRDLVAYDDLDYGDQ